MRKKILARIEEIRKSNNGFKNSKWENFSHGANNCHIKHIDFELLNSTELLFLFERLIRRNEMNDAQEIEYKPGY